MGRKGARWVLSFFPFFFLYFKFRLTISMLYYTLVMIVFFPEKKNTWIKKKEEICNFRLPWSLFQNISKIKIPNFQNHSHSFMQNAIHKAREIGYLNAQRHQPDVFCEKSILMSQNAWENAFTGALLNKMQAIGQQICHKKYPCTDFA